MTSHIWEHDPITFLKIGQTKIAFELISHIARRSNQRGGKLMGLAQIKGSRLESGRVLGMELLIETSIDTLVKNVCSTGLGIGLIGTFAYDSGTKAEGRFQKTFGKTSLDFQDPPIIV